jgi:hypothetical protein
VSTNGTLVLHTGARPVTLEELAAVKAPEPVGRWFPLAHHKVLARVKETLGEAGFEVKRESLALSRLDNRFFGVLDLTSPLSEGVALSVGVRNSIDKSFPIGFCAGSRVFVCDNLAFSAELLVKRKHTKFGEQRFSNDIASAVVKLNQFKEDEGKRIAAMKVAELSAEKADSLILNAFEKGIITTPYLPKVLAEWREPKVEAFKGDCTYWGLFNAFTAALADRLKANPHAFATTTMRLSRHLVPPDVTFPTAA